MGFEGVEIVLDPGLEEGFVDAGSRVLVDKSCWMIESYA
jgi:hypothetical protein